MGNKNYQKGVRKEQKIKKVLEREGLTVLRTAGSHGFADLVAIDKTTRKIRFIQCKPDNLFQHFLCEFLSIKCHVFNFLLELFSLFLNF